MLSYAAAVYSDDANQITPVEIGLATRRCVYVVIQNSLESQNHICRLFSLKALLWAISTAVMYVVNSPSSRERHGEEASSSQYQN